MYKIVNVIGNEVTFAHNELLTIPQFQAIIDNHNNWKNYFMFLWFSCDWESPFVQDGLSKKLCIHNAVLEAQLENEFILDEVIENAMAKYKVLQNTGSLALLNSLLEGLKTTSDTVQLLTASMRDSIVLIKGTNNDVINSNNEDLFKLDGNETTTNVLDAAKNKEIIKDLMVGIGQLTNISKQVPDTIQQIEDLRKKVAAEMSEKKIKSGGGLIGDREVPTYIARLEKQETSNNGVVIKIKEMDDITKDSDILLQKLTSSLDAKRKTNKI